MSLKTKEESIEEHNRKFLEDLDNDKDHIKVYISCPITNDKDNYDKNFKIAVKAVESKTEDGHYIYRAVNPLDLKVGYSDAAKWTAKTWIECMKKDLDLLTHCDAMVLCPGWEVSAGCITEAIAARKIGIHVMSMHEPFGIFPDDKAFEDDGFPTYQMRDTWRKINEIKNLVSKQMTWEGYRLKAEKILDNYLDSKKSEKDTERKYVIRGENDDATEYVLLDKSVVNNWGFTPNISGAIRYKAEDAIKALKRLVEFQRTDDCHFKDYKFSIVSAPKKEDAKEDEDSTAKEEKSEKVEDVITKKDRECEDEDKYHILGFFRGDSDVSYTATYLMYFSEPALVDTKKTRSLDPDYTFSPDVEDAKTFTKEEAKHIVDVIEKYFKKTDIDAYLKIQDTKEDRDD